MTQTLYAHMNKRNFKNYVLKKKKNISYSVARCHWLKPVILATQEAEIRRIMV
jgi:hypothetical protein